MILHRFFKAVILGLLIFTASCADDSAFHVQKSTHFNILFDRKNGWTGGDGAYSLPLSDNKVLWLFGDTWVGKIRNNKHIESTLINNSVGIQQGNHPMNASIHFFFDRTPAGQPEALIKPVDGKGWLWIYHGIAINNDLYLFLVQIDRTGSHSEPGFKIIGTWLGHIQNPNDLPDRWEVKQYRIPWENMSESGDTIFGSSILLHNGFVYIYGTTEDIDRGVHRKHMILARARSEDLPKFQRWRFFSNEEWLKDFRSASRLCGDMANEYSVSYLPILDKFVTVYSPDSVSENIVLRSAPKPHGPWSPPLHIYTCPEANWDTDIYCYAAKAHPALTSNPDELIITYIASSTDFWKMVADARLYRPRFLTVKFSGAPLASTIQ